MSNLTFERPPLQRVQVVAKDKVSGKSKSVTVYGVTPEQIMDKLRQSPSKDGSPKRRGANAA